MGVIKVSDELYNELQKLAEKKGRAVKELADEALRAYLFGSGLAGKDIKSIKSAIISIHYQSKCARCQAQLNVNDLAYYVRYEYADGGVRSFVYCLDCYYSSSALKEQYLTKKKLEAVVRALKKEADELSEQVVKLRSEAKLYSLKYDILRLYRDFVDHMSDQDLKQKLSEFLDRLEEIDARINNILEDMKYFNKVKPIQMKRNQF
jgi:hypothetical protein